MSTFMLKIPDSLRDSTICLTGFTGYVGRHLLNSLIAAGIRPFLIPRRGSSGVSTQGADCATAWTHAGELAEQLGRFKDPVVINLAGHFISAHQPTDIEPLVAGNLGFPVMILDALVAAGHRRIVNVGTTWEFSDTGAPVPRNLYGQLKATNAQTLEWYATRAPLQAINLKLNDTFGGEDPRAKLLPLLKRHWIEGKPLQLRSWAQLINLLHITDVQDGLLAAAERTALLAPHTVETALLLAEETTRLGEIVDRLTNEIAPGLAVDFSDRSPENAALSGVWTSGPRLKNWSPRVSLEAGLRDYFKVDA
jgi:nucleoside-diphosphate-sugar epimerase